MPKKVVLLKSQLGQKGGLEKYTFRIAQGFAEAGAQISLLTTGEDQIDSPDFLSHANLDIESAHICRWPAFWRMEQFDRFVQRWVEKHPADLIFGIDRNRYQTHLRAGNGVHAAFLHSRSYTDSWLKQFSCFINPLHLKILQFEKEAFEHPELQKLFVNSQMVRREILHYYRTDPSKIEVVHNGVEWEEMENDFGQWPLQKKIHARECGIDPSLFQFLFIGNGYLRKGLKQLLHALARLPRRDFFLSVVGKDNRKEVYDELVRELGLSKHVKFFGHQRNVRPFYQLADSLVIPSFYDPFANVTVEALAMGLFVVSSASNGGHEILTPVNGTVIANLLDPGSLVDSLIKALNHPKTAESASRIRQSVCHLDFSRQIHLLVNSCFSSRPYGT